MDNTEKLKTVRVKIKRWQTKAKRANNMVDKLLRQERRLVALQPIGTFDAWGRPVKPAAKEPEVQPEAPAISVDDPDLVEKVSAALAENRKRDAALAVGHAVKDALLDIPKDFIREPLTPEQKAEAKAANQVLTAALLNPAAEVNRRRLERMDAKRRGRALKPIDKTAMPLTGKAAKEAIRRSK